MQLLNALYAFSRVSAIHISCSFSLSFGCTALGTLFSTFAVLCTQQRCCPVVGQCLVKAFQNPNAPSPMASFGGTCKPRADSWVSTSCQPCSLSRYPST